MEKGGSSAGELALEATNLRKAFGDFVAVDGVSFSVRRGEVLGILGPNGAGKTTTIRLITGIYDLPPGSTVLVEGRDLARETNWCKSQFGIVPEVSNAFLDYPVVRNMEFSGRIYGIDKATLRSRTAALLEQFDLTGKARSKTKTLSKGLRQRLNFCMALVHDPPILILDEPTSGLDPMSVRMLRESIKSFRERGKTILTTTHDMREAQTVCDRVLIMNHGKILVDEAPDVLREKFGGARRIILRPAKPLGRELVTELESAIPGDDPVRVDKGGAVEFNTSDPLEAFAVLNSFCRSHGVEVERVKLEEPSFEDAFLRLVKAGNAKERKQGGQTA
ncbi:MAG: ABC transporter ATP-binding protein [Promethearchaeota archaeon]